MCIETPTRKKISSAEQGRLAFKGACVTDDASTLIEIFAAHAAKYELRMALQRESTRTDARY